MDDLVEVVHSEDAIEVDANNEVQIKAGDTALIETPVSQSAALSVDEHVAVDADVKKFHALSYLEEEAKELFAHFGIGNEKIEEIFEWVAKKLPQ